jgi:hypothetical protein
MACKVSLLRRMPREVPLTSSMAPLRASAWRCSGRVGRFEAERGGDFCACGRGAGAGDGALDKIEDLLLAISQFGSD